MLYAVLVNINYCIRIIRLFGLLGDIADKKTFHQIWITPISACFQENVAIDWRDEPEVCRKIFEWLRLITILRQSGSFIHKYTALSKVEETRIEIIHITHLTFDKHFNLPVDSLPLTLTHLTFGKRFNQTINALPPSITHIVFGKLKGRGFKCDFDQCVDFLPDSVTSITFGNKFNHTVDLLPSSIKHLTFGKRFNQEIKTLPPSLSHLTFGDNFLQHVTVPPTLEFLYLARKTQRQFVHNIPKTCIVAIKSNY